MAGIGLNVPAILRNSGSGLCVLEAGCLKLVTCKVMSNAQIHNEIKTAGKSMLNSINDLISEAFMIGKHQNKNLKVFVMSREAPWSSG